MFNQFKSSDYIYTRSLNFLFLLLFIILISSPCSIYSAEAGQRNQSNLPQYPEEKFSPVDPVIIWNYSAAGEDSIDQVSFYNALANTGLPANKVNQADLGKTELNKNMLLILPQSVLSSISDNDAERIITAVNSGARVVTDGSSKLTRQLNIIFSEPVSVKYVHDAILHSPILCWPDAPSVPVILNPTDNTIHTLYADSISGNALGIFKSSGKGMVIILSAIFDPLSGEGYSRFPNLTNHIISGLQCRPMFQRSGIDAYFDPGYRWDDNVTKLVSMWKKWGIRAIHAAVWDLYTDSPYNFKTLVNEAHKQGILVYAWLEWPYVGTGFWEKHPEWREKNALLKDAQLDFLLLMDLQNPACMKQTTTDLINLLKEDWDGVDIAEFSITGGVAEALEGPDQPKYFTGFNDETRQEFKSLHGFDQIDLFNKSSEHYWKKDSAGLDLFYKYRVMVNDRLLRQIVSTLDSVKVTDKRDWEFIFTVLDNSLHPEFDQLLGFDLPNTLKLAKEFHAALQVEDPASEWTRPPSRYQQLANYYKGVVGEIPFAIDINIVPIHPVGQPGFPSEQPTGAELFKQYNIADKACGRVCFYAESSVYPYDWDVLPYAMASGVTYNKDKNQWHIETPNTVIMQNPSKAEKIFLDGKAWPCYTINQIIIPKGKHILSFVPVNPDTSKLRITGIADELISCRQLDKGVELVYQSPARCFISTNTAPGEIKVDGGASQLKAVKVKAGYFILAPSGRHTLLILR